MPTVTELLRSVCDDAGDGDHHTIYAPQNGFEVYLGKRGMNYAFTIRRGDGEDFCANEHHEDVAALHQLLLNALHRMFNSRDDFDEDDEFETAWVEATAGEDIGWTREQIDEWLGNELEQLFPG